MYLHWQEEIITDFSQSAIEEMYNRGFVFTRFEKGNTQQTRSLRIDLSKFELSSENRRVLKKNESLSLDICHLPMPNYDWKIAKLAKDFYDNKFGAGVFSANKIKELLTSDKSNFNFLLKYSWIASSPTAPRNDVGVGYAICHETKNILHYSYPFYQRTSNKEQVTNIGMGMMLNAILWAKENNKKYIYLGSFQRPTNVYKLQFAGLEWFDGEGWQTNLETLKKIL